MSVQFGEATVVAEVRKNKADVIRVSRLKINDVPYVSLQVFTTWSDKTKSAGAPQPEGKPIVLKSESVPDLISALTTAWIEP